MRVPASVRAFVVFGVLMLFATMARAALSGTRTVGPTGNYPSLTGAITDIQLQGLDGALLLELQPAYVSSVETFPLSFTALGTTAVNTLTIRPQAGATNRVITSVAAQTVDLNIGSFVTFDGRAGGTGTTKDLTIENTSTSGVALRFVNGSANDTIKFVNLRGSTAGPGIGMVFFATTATTGNNGNTIDSCDLAPSSGGPPFNAIYSEGTAGAENANNTISNCTISDFFHDSQTSVGILLGPNNTSWTITGNRIFQTAARAFTAVNTDAAVRIQSGQGHVVSNNTIGFATAAGTGAWTMSSVVATRFIAIDLAVGATATEVQGNLISGFSMTTSSSVATSNGVWCGINVTAGNVNIGTTSANTIGGASGAALIAVNSSTTGALVVGINLQTTGTSVVQGNTIGGLASANATAATIGGAVTGIQNSAAGTVTIAGNLIGNPTANSMSGGSSGVTTASSLVSGINLPTAPTTGTITNNTIQNLSSFGTGAAGFVRGIWTAASTGKSETCAITGNTIHDLQTNSSLSTITSGQASAVGINVGVGTNDVVAQNTIYNVAQTNTGTSSYFAAGITLSNATNTTVSGNTIYGVSNAGTGTTATAPPTASGIVIRSGTTAVNIFNNMISLGTGQTTNTAFVGIYGNHGSTPDPVDKIYHNTINITGTVAAGALSSFGFLRGDFTTISRTQTIDFRNNIVTNTRSGGTGGHYAIGNNFNNATSSATGWGAGASDFNVLNADGATVGHWTSAQTFAGWQTASAGDVSSYSGIAVNYVNAASDLHLSMGTTPTALESSGASIASVTTDIDGQARPGPAGSVNGGAAVPDLGADEFDGVPIDTKAPVIAFTPLPGSHLGGETLSGVSIKDITGVPTTGSLVPRIYYRKNAGAYFSQPGTLTSGSARDGVWSFPIVAADMGGLVPGDVIAYYVIAQDTMGTPNVGSSPGGVTATDVNNVSVPPGAPFTVTAYADLVGNVNVGSGGAYPTLTAAVTAYNGGTIAGPTTFVLTDATYAGETFPIVINGIPAASQTNSLTIKPAAGVSPVISGSSATSIIQFNGARYVTLDGTNGATQNTLVPRVTASRDLTLTNTNTSTTSAVVWMNTTSGGAGVQHCTVQNCVVAGSGRAFTGAGLGAGGVAIPSQGKDNDDLSFINNAVSACRVAILSQGESGANKNSGFVANLNTIGAATPNEVGFGGIVVLFADGITVSANTLSLTAPTGGDLAGINLGFVTAGTGANSIAATGSGTADGISNATVTNNTFGTLSETSTFAAAGIAFGNTTSGTSLIANNMISGVAANATSPDIGAGIVVGGGGAGTVKVLHNTVAMQGTTAGASAATQTSACLAVIAAPGTLDVRDNIFSNTQAGNAGATMRFAAIALGYSAPYTGLLSDRNALFCAGAGPGTYTLGITGGMASGAGTNRFTLTDWQTETGQDANSLNVTPTFVSATDLHLADGNQPGIGAGVSVAEVTTDIDLNPRNAVPDLGADEFTTPVPTLSQVTSATFQGAKITVSFSLPQAAQDDSVRLIFDNGTVQIFELKPAFETAGAHTLRFNPDDPMASGFFDSASPLANGTYSVSLTYQDPFTHRPASSATINGVVVSSGTPPAGVLDLGYNAQLNSGGVVHQLVTQPDGKVIIGGSFDSVAGTPQKNLARLNPDGSLDASYPGSDFQIRALALQPDGRLLVESQLPGILRRNADGSDDLSFAATTNSAVFGFLVQPDGRIVIYGIFSTVNGMPRANIARLNADGSTDLSFDAGTDAVVYDAVLQPDGQIVICGYFATVNGQPRQGIARLNPDGSVEGLATFDPGTGSSAGVNVLALQHDGKIVIGGGFFTVNDESHLRLARLLPNGNVDATFTPSVVGGVEASLVTQADGKIVITGDFTTVNGQPCNSIARLNADGTLDGSTAFGDGPTSTTRDVNATLQADGGIFVFGDLTGFDGDARNGLVRLTSDAATQTLTTPDATQVQWQRSGATVEVSSVEFQRSLDDGATWSSLGDGARVAGGWALTGVNLSNQFGLIRALGRASGGQLNGGAGLAGQTASFDFDTFTLGNDTQLPNSGGLYNPNQISFRTINVPSASMLVKLCLIVSSPNGSSANFALYRNDGQFGRPGSLVAQTGAFGLVGGRNEISIGTPMFLEAGDYYFATIFSGSPTIYNDPGFSVGVYVRGEPFTGNLPASYDGVGLNGGPTARVGNYLQLGTLSPAPTLAKPATNSFSRTQLDVDFTLSQPAQSGSLKLSFAGPVQRTFTLADTLLTAVQHTFHFNPGDPLATSSGAIASASSNDLPDGVYTVSLTYRDTNNEGPGTVTATNVTIDHVAPGLTLPTTFTAEATGADGATVDFSAAVSASDNIDPAPVVVATPASGTLFAIGNTTVNVTATDAATNQNGGSFTVKVQDTTPPQFVAPTPTSTITIEATSPNGGVATFTLVATDLVDASPTIELTAGLPSGSTFPLGFTTVAFKATDDYANSVTGSFQVEVRDSTKPTLTVPSATKVVEATSASGAVVDFSGDISATDLVDTSVTIVATPASGSTFALGTTSVSVKATDDAGNQITKTFNVRVRDTTAPVIQPHADVVVATATDLGGAIVNYDPAVVSDAVSSTPTVTYSQNSNTVFPLGQTTVTVTAKDDFDNTSTSEFNVTVYLASPNSNVEHRTGGDAPGRLASADLPDDAILASFGVPATDDNDDLAFVAKWTSAAGPVKKGAGLFLNDKCLGVVGGEVTAVSGAKFKSFSDPVVDEGIVVVIAGLSGVKVPPSAVLSNTTGTSTLDVIAKAGDVAPGPDGSFPTGGAKFKTFKSVSIAGGAIAIFAQLTGGTGTEKITAANDLGVWMKDGTDPLKLVVREGKPVLPGDDRKVKTLVTFASGNGSPGQGRGWLTRAYGPMALALVTFTDKSQVVISAAGDGNAMSFTRTSKTGIEGPALTDATFASYSFPAANAGDTVTFLGSLTVGAGGVAKTNARGIFLSSGAGDYTSVARVGDDAPNTGAKFSVLKDPVLDGDEAIAFPATIKGGTVKGLNGTTLWWQPAQSGLFLLAQAGPNATPTVPNDLPANAQWKSFTSLAIAGGRGPIFTGTLVPNKGGVTAATATGAWAVDYQGTVRTLFRTGATNIITGKTLKSFTVLKTSLGSTGVTRNFNTREKVVWLATFKEDKSQAIITTQVP